MAPFSMRCLPETFLAIQSFKGLLLSRSFTLCKDVSPHASCSADKWRHSTNGIYTGKRVSPWHSEYCILVHSRGYYRSLACRKFVLQSPQNIYLVCKNPATLSRTRDRLAPATPATTASRGISFPRDATVVCVRARFHRQHGSQGWLERFVRISLWDLHRCYGKDPAVSNMSEWCMPLRCRDICRPCQPVFERSGMVREKVKMKKENVCLPTIM